MTSLEKLQKFATTMGLTLVCRYPDVEGNWMVGFDSIEIKEGSVLSSTCGRATKVDNAATEYLCSIAGKRLIAHATNDKLRREIVLLSE